MKLLEVAISQIGVEEDKAHSNHGEAIKYQEAAGLGKNGGFPWCQSFVFWCGREAYGSKNPVPKTGGVLDCWHKAQARVVKAAATPQNIHPGYQFILNHGHGAGHTGIVESVDADGMLHTIEGNSNDDGSRDGYEVCRLHKRRLTDVQLLGFIAYTDPA